MKDWIFYVLRGQTSAEQQPSFFWKVGTLPSSCVPQPLPASWTMPMNGRTTYGSYVDPELSATQRIYFPSKASSREGSARSTTIGYRPPQLGAKTVADPIAWEMVHFGVRVGSKQIDQLIAAFADDEGKLIRNRGRLRRPITGDRYSGAIEIIDGRTDLFALICWIGLYSDRPNLQTRRMSAQHREDIEALSWQLAPKAADLRHRG